MSIFHDVPTPLSFANKKNKMELVKLFKDVPKDIIDGTGACPVAPADRTGACPAVPCEILQGYLSGVGSKNRTGACPVQFFAEDKRSLPRRSGRSYWGVFHWGGSKNKNDLTI